MGCGKLLIDMLMGPYVHEANIEGNIEERKSERHVSGKCEHETK